MWNPFKRKRKPSSLTVYIPPPVLMELKEAEEKFKVRMSVISNPDALKEGDILFHRQCHEFFLFDKWESGGGPSPQPHPKLIWATPDDNKQGIIDYPEKFYLVK